jgi:hypothetical protein
MKNQTNGSRTSKRRGKAATAAAKLIATIVPIILSLGVRAFLEEGG